MSPEDCDRYLDLRGSSSRRSFQSPRGSRILTGA
jgi:hypothetical protein